MAVIGSLSVKLGLVTVEWDQATKKAKQDAKDLQKAFEDLTGNVKTLYGHWKTLGGALSLSAVGMASLITQTLQFSDAVSDLAKGFDLSIAKTLQFREAIKSSGGNAEGASKMLSTLFSKIEDARGGNESAIAQFQKLGISFEELVKLSPEQALNRVFKEIANIGNTYERVKAVKEMLGKAGIGIEVDAVAQKLGMSTAQYQTYAKSIEKVAQVNDDLAATFDNLKIAFADMIAPFTREGVVSIEKFKAAMVALTAGAIIGGLTQLVTLTGKLIALWKEGAKVQVALTALGGGKGLLQLGAATAAYFAALKAFDIEAEQRRSEAERTVSGRITDANGNPIEAQNQTIVQPAQEETSRRELLAAQAKLDLAKKQLGFLKTEGQIKFDALISDKYSIQLREAQLIMTREIAAAESQRAQALSKENLSQEQKRIIQGEYQTAVAAANEKNRQAIKVITAERDIANKQEITADRIKMELAGKQLEYIKMDGALKVDALTNNKYDIELRESQLNLTKEIASIESQRAQSLNKENLTAQQRQFIENEYQASVDAAYEKHLQNSKRINAERNIANNQEIVSDKIKMDLAAKQLVYIKMEGLLKVQSLNADKYAIQLSESELSLMREMALIESQRTQALNKENLTAQQIQFIGNEYQASVKAADEKHLQNIQRINAEREKEYKLIGVQIEAARKTEAFNKQRIKLEEQRINMSDFAYKVAQEELSVKQRISDLEQQIIDARNRIGTGAIFDAEKARITDLIEAEKNLSEFRMHSIQMEEYRRRSFSEGWRTAMNNYMEDSTNAARVAGSMFSSIVNNLDSALDRFVRTGKLKFSDLARSIIQDLIAIQIKAQASTIFSMIAKGFGFGFSGTAVGASQYSLSYGLPSTSSLGLQARAGGGDISSGQPYLVGERGPELVVPRSAGTVIPNHSLAGAIGGGPSVVYNGPYIANMSAIDTQSGLAFLAKNKQGVWAANQSAQRSLPVSR